MECHSPPQALCHTETSGGSHAKQSHPNGQSPLAQDGLSTSEELTALARIFRSSLLSLLPPDLGSTPSLLTSRIATQRETFGISLHGLLVFSIENNFAGLSDVPIQNALKFLKQDPQMHLRLLKYHQVIDKNVSKALLEKLFLAAVEGCDAPSVSQYLNTGFVRPDEIVCTINGLRYTALERAVMLDSLEVTRVLLNNGADVNKTYKKSALIHPGPLGLAIPSKWSPDQVVKKRLVNVLLDSGARVYVQLAKAALQCGDSDLVTAVKAKFIHFDCCSAWELLEDAGKLADNELAVMVIMQIVQACSQSGHSHGSSGSAQLASALTHQMESAVKNGNSKLVMFLLEYNANIGPALIAAIRNGRKDIVNCLLENGADIDTVTIGFPFGVAGNTPISEAIRAGDVELIQHFESRGALSKISERRRFEAAIFAAAEVGNLSFVRKLLGMAPGMDGENMYNALVVSLEKGYESIAVNLLQAGASVNSLSSTKADESSLPLLEALRRRNKLLVNKIMDCDLVQLDNSRIWKEAASWGNTFIFKDLASTCVLADPQSGLIAITAAVKARNKALVDLLFYDFGIRVDIDTGMSESPLEAAVSNQDIKMLQYLLDLGAETACSRVIREALRQDDEIYLDVLLRAFRAKYPHGKRCFGSEVLVMALVRDRLDRMDKLLEAGLDINVAQGNKSRTRGVLGVAIEKYGGRNPVLIKKLISAGEDPNGVISSGQLTLRDAFQPPWTVLLKAIGSKNRVLVELLINAGADIHRGARLGLKRSPLQYACEVGCLEIVDLLLERGADVNEAPALRGGATSLQLCAIQGYCGIAHKLWKLGADIHAAPAEVNGRTAFEGAAEHGRLYMLMLLWDLAAGTGFSLEEFSRAMELAEENGHMACRDQIREYSLACQAFLTPEPLNLEMSPYAMV